MQVRFRSKTGPLIPSDDDLLLCLRDQTEALQSQWRDRLAHDPAGFAQWEVEIHDHFRRLADQMTASLLAQATTTHDQAEPGKKGDSSHRRRPPRPRTAHAETPPARRPGRLDHHDLLRSQGRHRETTGPGGDGPLSRTGGPGHPQGSHPGAAIAGGPPDRLAPLDRVGARRTATARPGAR
jgi:hypothetical protein